MAKKNVKIDEDYKAEWAKQPMRKPFIEKVVVNIAVGMGGEKLQNAQNVIETLTGQKSVLLKAKKSIKEWDIRKRQNIAVKVTLRGTAAEELLKKTLVPTDNRILKKCFDNFGNFSFGIDEHIKIPGMKYDPSIGIYGMDIAVRIVRPGMRIKTRKKNKRSIAASHYVNRNEAIYYINNIFGAEVVDVMEERYY
jgi:large subunit ribosomal protein L5